MRFDGGAPSGAGGVFARKTNDQTLTQSNTTLQDVTGLSLAVAAGRTYTVDGFIIHDGSATADIKIGFTGPAGATFDWAPVGLVSSAASTSASITMTWSIITSNRTLGLVGAGTKTVSRPVGCLVVATAGTLQFQAAQSTSEASDVIVYAGSWLRATLVG